ncbi:MAG: sterol desaturase family protein [Pirellulaceae bacterium]
MTPDSAGELAWLKPVVTVALLALFWSWESWFPFFRFPSPRWPHAGRNVAIALLNTVVLSLLFGVVTVGVTTWTAERQWGLLHQLSLVGWSRLLLAIVLLDLWMYVWHRLNHKVPFLWRFHRMHHSDSAMDVTSATRFHLGEHLMGATLRLSLIPLLGIELLHLLVFETLVVANTMLHHANISLGIWDKPLRLLLVTPNMHKVHHSRIRTETNSNYATLFSCWDRLFYSFRRRADYTAIELGLDEFQEPQWQTLRGLLKTPLAPAEDPTPPADE